jgi:hypothetical protein
LLLQGLQVLPGSIPSWRSTPLDQSLGNSAKATLAHSLLKNTFRHLKDMVSERELGLYLLPWTQTLLQLRHMEHWVDSAMFRQVKFVCHCTNTLQHSEGAKKLECQLLVTTMSHCRLQIRLQLEEDTITHRKNSL